MCLFFLWLEKTHSDCLRVVIFFQTCFLSRAGQRLLGKQSRVKQNDLTSRPTMVPSKKKVPQKVLSERQCTVRKNKNHPSILMAELFPKNKNALSAQKDSRSGNVPFRGSFVADYLP